LNEAQLINPQGNSKNMAARDKLEILENEWIAYGGSKEFESKEIVVIRKNEEWLIRYGRILVHLTRDVIATYNGRWYTSSLRKDTKAVRVARMILKRLPKDIVSKISTFYPTLVA
jgi:hypothetical protein